MMYFKVPLETKGDNNSDSTDSRSPTVEPLTPPRHHTKGNPPPEQNSSEELHQAPRSQSGSTDSEATVSVVSNYAPFPAPKERQFTKEYRTRQNSHSMGNLVAKYDTEVIVPANEDSEKQLSKQQSPKKQPPENKTFEQRPSKEQDVWEETRRRVEQAEPEDVDAALTLVELKYGREYAEKLCIELGEIRPSKEQEAWEESRRHVREHELEDVDAAFIWLN
jgi:hypothetical protein